MLRRPLKEDVERGPRMKKPLRVEIVMVKEIRLDAKDREKHTDVAFHFLGPYLNKPSATRTAQSLTTETFLVKDIMPLSSLPALHFSCYFLAFPQVMGSFQTPLPKASNLLHHMEIFILSFRAPLGCKMLIDLHLPLI